MIVEQPFDLDTIRFRFSTRRVSKSQSAWNAWIRHCRMVVNKPAGLGVRSVPVLLPSTPDTALNLYPSILSCPFNRGACSRALAPANRDKLDETFLEKYHCHYDRMVNKLQSVESKDSWTALTISKIPESW